MLNNICLRVIPVVALALFGACLAAEPDDAALTPAAVSECTGEDSDPSDCGMQAEEAASAEAALVRECTQVDQWCANSCEPSCGWALWDWELYGRCMDACYDSCCILRER